MKNDLHEASIALSNDSREYYLGESVKYLSRPPTPIEFMREYVSCNSPVLIDHVTSHWPALTIWSNEYLKKKLENKSVSVAIVPDGRADAIKLHRDQQVFALPYEKTMPFDHLMNVFESDHPTAQGVHYLQPQNNSMHDEYSSLLTDIDPHLQWATEAFGVLPDVVNFWMGRAESVTSLHKDNYENLYAVVRGEKIFTIYPPTDAYFIECKKYPVYRYNAEMELRSEECEEVPWYSMPGEFPKPFRVTVKKGQVLYLPALWYHQVEQVGDPSKKGDLCIAVNYWYDMRYDMKSAVHSFLDRLRNENT